eukprot:6352089-Pyramimonas_sp.AAC.1
MDPPESSEASPEDRAEPAADGFKLTEEQCATIKNAMAALDIKYKPAWARWVKEGLKGSLAPTQEFGKILSSPPAANTTTPWLHQPKSLVRYPLAHLLLTLLPLGCTNPRV